MVDVVEIDNLTKQWIRDKSDVRAASKGCSFNVVRGAYAVWWIERYCRLYEGSQFAGQPVRLRGCSQCEYEFEGVHIYPEMDVPSTWEEAKPFYLERALRHNECFHLGHFLDWQFECMVRLYSWVKWSHQWQKEVRRFREGSIWVAKKNKKTPTMAANTLYLGAGDGEEGQKVFLGSKDATQVRENAAKHVMEMVERSPELSEVCRINRVQCSVTHLPTSSKITPLSSSNSRTQESKEGLNGSLAIDESHVVDRAFISRISRAGISRAEPLNMDYSTAGKDPDGWGMERFQEALGVIDGTVENDQMFAAVYAAPQNLKDSDLAADPLKYGRMANPAMGHTVDPEEFLTDYQKSKGNPRAFAEFKMYRLNIWQNSESPWLLPEWWEKGKQDFTLANVKGRACWTALDMSSVRDFSSLCVGFPESATHIKYLWWYWLPEDTARELSDRIPIDEWLADERVNLELTPGARIDPGFIRSQVRTLSEELNIKELTYDDWNAEKVTQEIEQGCRDHHGHQTEPGTGIPRIAFDQSLREMNEPTKIFEGMVMEGQCLHNGDPLTAWMIRNARIKPDCNNNYKPMKPGKDSILKVDGVVTAVMVTGRIKESGFQAGSVYETRGIRTL